MTTQFDAQKALREELSGLGDIRESLLKTERRAQQRMLEAEEEYNTVAKVRGFVDTEVTRKRVKLANLVEGK